MAGFTDNKLNLPGRGERVAKFVQDYLDAQPGLSAPELASRLQADKRDMERLLRDQSVGHRLEDKLAAYFGQLFIDALFPPEHFGGRSIRERELQHELAQIEARNAKLERERAQRRAAAAAPLVRLVDGEGRRRPVSNGGDDGSDCA